MNILKVDSQETINMCDFCEYKFPECNPKTIAYGNGKGNDNVIRCSCFKLEDNLKYLITKD